ncbi:RNI-like superfamily protein [Wolffia australiana]
MECSSSHGSASEPHAALFFVLGYLPLREIFAAQRTCRSLRDAIAGDDLLWRGLRVEPPLSRKLTDGALIEVASRAKGRLTSLSLVDCWLITDAALRRVVDGNPCIVKINVPGCSRLTADGVVNLVHIMVDQKKEKEKKKRVVEVGINGIPGLGKEHLHALNTILAGEECSLDVQVCPKCDDVRVVTQCTRESCRATSVGQAVCRGCNFCIARCAECGGCVDGSGEDSACFHTLCLNCWLRLTKCSLCNRAVCSAHLLTHPGDLPSPFTCDDCSDPFSPPPYFDL